MNSIGRLETSLIFERAVILTDRWYPLCVGLTNKCLYFKPYADAYQTLILYDTSLPPQAILLVYGNFLMFGAAGYLTTKVTL